MKLIDITTEDLATLVGLLTVEQKEEIAGKPYSADSLFNPIQDIDDNWVISTEEMIYCTNEAFIWVKDLELIPYIAKPTPSPF